MYRIQTSDNGYTCKFAEMVKKLQTYTCP